MAFRDLIQSCLADPSNPHLEERLRAWQAVAADDLDGWSITSAWPDELCFTKKIGIRVRGVILPVSDDASLPTSERIIAYIRDRLVVEEARVSQAH